MKTFISKDASEKLSKSIYGPNKKGLGELMAVLKRFWRGILGALPLVNFAQLFQTHFGFYR